MEATYNICDDKLRASFDERLPEDDYKRIKAAGFSYWHGSKLFVAKWSVTAEDALISFGFEIEDADAPDDVEARVDRFSGYAANAESSAESASNYAHSLVEGIPMGQPILVGHHSERGHRATLKRCDAATRRADARLRAACLARSYRQNARDRQRDGGQNRCRE